MCVLRGVLDWDGTSTGEVREFGHPREPWIARIDQYGAIGPGGFAKIQHDAGRRPYLHGRATDLVTMPQTGVDPRKI